MVYFLIFKYIDQLKGLVQEGVNSGVITVGVIKGSSIAGYNEEDWRKLSEDKRVEIGTKVKEKFEANGADYIIYSIRRG